MDGPLVSIILPTFNRSFCLGRAIGSVIGQTFSNWELIVVDNYSTDNSKEIIESFYDERIKYFKFSNNGIVAASRNFGIKRAKGKYLAFVDSDDWWICKKLELSVSALENGADFTYHDLYNVSSLPVKKNSDLKRLYARKLKRPIFMDLVSNGNTIFNSSVVVRHDLVIRINGFSENAELVTSEDYHGWLMISRLTDKFKKIDGILGYYWNGGGNLSSSSSTIISNNYLESIFFREFKLNKTPGWMHYDNSRALLLSGKYTESRFQARRAIFKNVSLRIRIKAIYTWFEASIRKFMEN